MPNFRGDRLPDELADRLATERLAELRAAGLKFRHGWDRRAPCVEFVEGGHGAYYIPGRHWIDHPYRLVNEAGVVTYCSEPYDLGPDCLAELLALEEQGWHVVLTGLGLYYPAHTLVIRIRRGRNGGAP